MPLSTNIRQRLARAFADKDAGKAVADAIDAANKPIANIANLAATSNLRVDTLANLGADAEARLDGLEAKVNSTLTALKTAGKMIAD